MLKNITFIAACFCLSAATHAYDSFEELMTDIGRKQVDALKTYIEDNPDADDVRAAESQLAFGLIAQDNFSEALSILEKHYASFPEDKSSMDLSIAFGEVVVPMIQLYQMDRRKDDGKAFIAKVRKDFSQHGMVSAINEALDEFLAEYAQPGVGESIELSFTAIDDREVDLAELKGKVVLIDFWATWCRPCIISMPEIISLHESFNDQGFEIIGISLDEDLKRLESFIKKENMPWPQYFDGLGWNNKLARQFGISAIPATLLIGPDGTIAAVNPKGSELRQKVIELLKAE